MQRQMSLPSLVVCLCQCAMNKKDVITIDYFMYNRSIAKTKKGACRNMQGHVDIY